MATNKQEKSAAELYREERKERLAKATKKKDKSTGSGKFGKTINKVVAVVLVLAVLAGIGWSVYSQAGLRERFSTVATMGSQKFNAVVYNYQYRISWQGFLQQTGQTLAQYGMYDLYKNPSDQKYNDAFGTIEGAPKFNTWADFFTFSVLQSLNSSYALYSEAQKVKGYEKMNDEDKKQMEEDIKEMRETAAKNNFSLNAYLKYTYGSGLNEKVYRQQVETSMVAQRFSEYKQNEFSKVYTDEKLRELYKENRNDYDVVSYRSYLISGETLTKKDGESDADFTKRKEAEDKKTKQKAEALLAKAGNEKTFLNAVKDLNKDTKDYNAGTSTLQMRQAYSAVESVSKDAAKWAFDTSRKNGDTALYGENNSYTVFYMLTPRYAPHPVDVRHILVPFKEDKSTENVTKEEKSKALQQAQSIYDEWKKGKKTQDSFAELAKTKSKDEGSAKEGGLIKDIRSDSSYVSAFLNWSLDLSRKVGDTEIIETEYGYHIMYLSNAYTDRPEYMDTILEDKKASDYEAYLKDLLEKPEYKITKNDKNIAWGTKKSEEWIATMIKQMQQSQ